MSDAGGLAGKRVVLTRAQEQATESAELLRARGATPVALPVIAFSPPKDPEAVARALEKLGEYAWVAFTSVNGVAWTWTALEARGKDARAFDGVKVAVIGPGTASALAERGVHAAVVASEHKGEGLAAAMLGAMGKGESALLLRAQVARDALPDALREAGHAVDDVGVYETRPATGQDVDRVLGELSRGTIDAVTFTSSSTVDHFVAIAGGPEPARMLLATTCVGSIGPLTSASLVAHGLRVDAQAEPHTFSGLLDALEASIGRAPRP